MASTIVIKVQYNDTLRRFNASLKPNGELDLDMISLKAKIFGLFDILEDVDLVLTYVDEDGDKVSLVDDNDLSDAMMQKLKLLRINVLLKNGRCAKVYTKSTGGSTAMSSPHVLLKNGRCAKVYTKSTGGSTAMSSPHVLKPFDTRNVFGSSPLRDQSFEELNDLQLKLAQICAREASSSSQVAGEVVDSVSKLGLSPMSSPHVLSHDVLLRMHSDLVSKASWSRKVAGEIVDCASRLELFRLKIFQALQDPIQKTLDNELLNLYSDLASKASSSSRVADEIIDGLFKFESSFLKYIHSPQVVGSSSGSVAPKDGCQKDLSPKSKAKSSVDKFTSDYNMRRFSSPNQVPSAFSSSARAPHVPDSRFYDPPVPDNWFNAPPPKSRFPTTMDPIFTNGFPPKSVSRKYPSPDKDIYSMDSPDSEADQWMFYLADS